MVCAEPQLPIVEKMVLPLFLGGLQCGMALSMLPREWTLSHSIFGKIYTSMIMKGHAENVLLLCSSVE